MNTVARIQEIIAAQTGLPVEQLAPARPLDELGVDSLTVIEAMFLVENEFEVVMPSGAVSLRTVQDIADLVDRLSHEREASGFPKTA